LASRAFPLVVAALVCGCGGGGGDGDSGEGSTALSVTFAQASPRTVFASGSLSFNVSQAPSTTQQTACTLNGTTAAPCLTSATSGRIDYTSLPLGLHRMTVEVRGADGAVAARAEHVLELITPAVVVFGATPAGIAAAAAAARAGQRVVLLEPSPWVGGMMSGGLAKTDIGPRGNEIIGGFAAEFFQRARNAAISRGICPDSRCTNLYDFEPREAERIFESMLAETGVVVERLVRPTAVHKTGATIDGIATHRGDLAAEVFIDASYEGDLMALAGVSYTLGREPRVLAEPPDDAAELAQQEDHAGVLLYRAPRGLYVDPYRVPGDPASGTLPFVEPRPSPVPSTGDGDSRVMAYTYRLCVTDDPGNRTPFAPPAAYDPARYEAVARVALAWVADTGVDLATGLFNPAATVRSANAAYYKYDLNGGSTFSTDMTGPYLNQAYPEADEPTRERIRQDYADYVRGLLYFWQTDSRFGALNAEMARFGYCNDEFTHRGGWPQQLYVRTARRMIGEYVMNENDVMQNGRRPAIADVVGFGAYNIDVHTVRYMAAPLTWPDGVRRDSLVLEGFLIAHAPNDAPYPVPYRSLVPQAVEATNLLNPVTLSATHIAYASLRMEPTMMILGESAGVAAALAVEMQQRVQDIDYATLRARLLANGQRLVN